MSCYTIIQYVHSITHSVPQKVEEFALGQNGPIFNVIIQQELSLSLFSFYWAPQHPREDHFLCATSSWSHVHQLSIVVCSRVSDGQYVLGPVNNSFRKTYSWHDFFNDIIIVRSNAPSMAKNVVSA